MLRTCCFTLALAALGITPALAQGPYDYSYSRAYDYSHPGFYLGAGIGQSWMKNEIDGTNNNNFGFDVTAGIRPLPWFSAEVSYVDLGGYRNYYNCFGCYDDRHTRADGGAAFGVLYLPIPHSIAEFYGKAGVARLATHESGFPYYCATQCNYVVDDETNTGFAWGAGVQLHWWNFALRAGYEQFQNQVGRPSMLTAGAYVNF